MVRVWSHLRGGQDPPWQAQRRGPQLGISPDGRVLCIFTRRCARLSTLQDGSLLQRVPRECWCAGPARESTETGREGGVVFGGLSLCWYSVACPQNASAVPSHGHSSGLSRPTRRMRRRLQAMQRASTRLRMRVRRANDARRSTVFQSPCRASRACMGTGRAADKG